MMSILILYQIIILFMLNFVINLLKEWNKIHMRNLGVRIYELSEYHAEHQLILPLYWLAHYHKICCPSGSGWLGILSVLE